MQKNIKVIKTRSARKENLVQKTQPGLESFLQIDWFDQFVLLGPTDGRNALWAKRAKLNLDKVWTM